MRHLMRHLSRLVPICAAGVAVLAAGCGDPDETPDAAIPCFIGDMSQPLELQLVYRTIDGETAELVPGAGLPVIEAPQGGKFVMVGVRARNVECNPYITGSIADTCDLRVSFERRRVDLVPDSDGWGTPLVPLALDNFANVSTCPGEWFSRDLRNTPVLVRVRLEDEDLDREAEVMATVQPYCADTDATLRAICDCQCRPDYILGEACGTVPDAGPPVACAPDAGVLPLENDAAGCQVGAGHHTPGTLLSILLLLGLTVASRRHQR